MPNPPEEVHEHPVDVVRRPKAKSELKRQGHTQSKKSKWGWQRKYGLWTLVLAFLGLLTRAAVVPEVRRLVGLDRSSVVPVPAPAQAHTGATTALNNSAPRVDPTTRSSKIERFRPVQKEAASETIPSAGPISSNNSSAFYCGKVEHLPAGMTNNCQDIEIGENHVGGYNSVFENGGKADRILISGARVSPSNNGNATVVRTLPGGESTTSPSEIQLSVIARGR